MKHFVFFLLSLLTVTLHPARADSVFRDGDVFEMRVSGPPDELTREYNLMLTVGGGVVNVPIIGPVKAAGMSGSVLATAIETRLKQAKIFTVATVNITVKENPRTMIVAGSVRNPGKFPWSPNLTLMAAIGVAGGPTEYATDGMRVIRAGKAEKHSTKEIRKNPSLDPKVHPGDFIEQEGH